jgi:hypothetical protein
MTTSIPITNEIKERDVSLYLDSPVPQHVQQRLAQSTEKPIKEELEFTDLFTIPYNINRHDYIGKLSLDKYIDRIVPKEQFEHQFVEDIKRTNITVNGEVTDIVYTFVEEANKVTNENRFKHLSDIFDTFIRKYVPEISDKDLRKFKALICQHGQIQDNINLFNHFNKPVILYFFDKGIRINDYTLKQNNYKFKTTITYIIHPYNDPYQNIGNVSYNMLFDITNNSYSANIHVNFNQPTQPASQDDCFTFVKSLFNRTGGTRKKYKVYGMPYTYRKVYRKKCYKVSNKKRVFSKCTSKKKALRQLRLLRNLESK